MKVQSTRRMGKYFCPNFLQPLRENVDRKNRNCYVAKIEACTAGTRVGPSQDALHTLLIYQDNYGAEYTCFHIRSKQTDTDPSSSGTSR